MIKSIDKDCNYFPGRTEMKALRVMIQSYTQNPSFGDAKTFQEELDSTILKVQKLEAELHSYTLLHKELMYKLEQKQCSQRSALLSPAPSNASPHGSRSSSTGYGTMSDSDGEDTTEDTIVAAVYDYDGEGGDTTIPMVTGEEFIVTEEDEEGWTRVRRKNRTRQRCEGYVPTAYLRLV